MEKLKTAKLLEYWDLLFFKLSLSKLKKPLIMSHNGESIFEYPDTQWSFVPFPQQKGKIYNTDNLATVNKHDFIDEENFKASLHLAEKRWGDPGKVRNISWRLHTLIWASGYALKNFDNSNDMIFLECGTGKGYMAAGICNYYKFNNKFPEFYLVDTFKPYLESPNGVTNPADFAYSNDDVEVRKYFNKYANVKIITGVIPDALQILPEKKIAFLHLDLNNAQAESETLKLLKNSFIKGSIIVFDDYGGYGGNEQAKVHEEFAKIVERPLLVLPTGQGLIIM